MLLSGDVLGDGSCICVSDVSVYHGDLNIYLYTTLRFTNVPRFVDYIGAYLICLFVRANSRGFRGFDVCLSFRIGFLIDPGQCSFCCLPILLILFRCMHHSVSVPVIFSSPVADEKKINTCSLWVFSVGYKY